MIDSHCHLDFTRFDSDREQVLDRCRGLGVTKVLIPGTKASAWPAQIELCSRYQGLYFALGLHPYFLTAESEAALSLLENQLDTHSDCLAVGEIGLDAAIDVPMSLQQRLFSAQLDMACQRDLPVIIHHRKSHHHLLHYLTQNPPSRGGVVHGFSGSEQDAQKYIALGFMLGVGGTITYERAIKTRKALASAPLSSLLLETDAPDMPLCGFQGERNSPAQIPRILEALAKLRNESAAHVEAQTDANFRRLFGV